MRLVGLRSGMVAALVGFTAVVVTSPARAASVISVPASKPTIQAGIDAAVTGDTVVVAPGTYFEHIDFKGKAIEVRSSAGPTTTIIDGGGTSITVVFKSGETRASVLRGFTVSHGLIPSQGGPGLIAGAGIGMSNASPTIIQNVITDNDGGSHAGAGIGATGGAPLIQENLISGNRTGPFGGGGGLIAGAGAEIIMNTIEDNASGGGGGLAIYAGSPVVRGNLIRRNHAGAFNGGGIDIVEPGGSFVNNLILDNTADSGGGGVHLAAGATTVYLLNNTILRNQAATGAALSIEAGGSILANNLVAGEPGPALISCIAGLGQSPVFSHNDVYNGTALPYEGCADPTGTNGNISADPRLRADGSTPAADSPVIDAGDNTAAGLPTTDLNGAPRITDGDASGVATVDMGAVESAPATVAGDRYHPLSPARVLDTRTGLGAPVATLGPGANLELQITGMGGVPATGVSAVALHIAVTQPTAQSWLAAWPAGGPWPGVANLNFLAGQTVANLVVVKVGAGGKVDLLNVAGSTHVVADVAGWYGPGPDGARYFGLTPSRVLDTRTGAGAPPARVPTGGSIALQVTGHGGVPFSGVSAVVLNVTAVAPDSLGWLVAWPAGEAMPLASSLNFGTNQTVPNLVVVKVGAGGVVNLYNGGGALDIVADVQGYYGAGGAPGGAGFVPVTPARVLDTRIGIGAAQARLATGATLGLQATGPGGVPATGVSAVVLNVTAVSPDAPGWLVAWPAGDAFPLAANLNFAAGDIVPNLVTARVGASGVVNLFNAGGPVDLVADVAGWFTG